MAHLERVLKADRSLDTAHAVSANVDIHAFDPHRDPAVAAKLAALAGKIAVAIANLAHGQPIGPDGGVAAARAGGR